MMEEVGDASALPDQNVIHISLSTVIEPSVSYAQYEINLVTNDPSFKLPKSNFLRRYSDFYSLHSIMKKHFVHTKLPRLPPKSPFRKTFDLPFLDKRKDALEDYLRKLVKERVILSSKALHLFLQSSHSMVKIQNIIDGKEPEENGFVTESENTEIATDVVKSLSTEISRDEQLTESHRSSPSESKRVSFCDQVTVAEIHVS